MLDKLIGKKKKKELAVPAKEKNLKTVSSQRFNEMIEYYTAELKSRLSEIDKLKQENEMLIKTSLKSASRSDELRLQINGLREEIERLKKSSSE
jgi:HPt (histidine-containing phosphotransfer) domain-containing protein